MHRVVIIGGGFGGLYAARSLRKAPVKITLIDRRNFHLFQPLLYQVATAALSPANIASPLRYILKKQTNASVLMAEAVDFDPVQKRVILKDGEIPYDSLIVAAGSETNYFGHNEWSKHAPAIKSLEDATEVRRKILLAFESAERESDPEKRKAWLTFVVVGAGPTGVELAGSLGEIARDTLRNEFRSIHTDESRILLLDAVERVLMTYPPSLSNKAEKALQKLGVTFQSSTFVTGIFDDHIEVKRQNQPESIPTRTVLWAAGVQASPLGKILANKTGAVLQKGGKIVVDPDLTVPRHPDIFVVGDLAYLMQENQVLPGIAPVAIQEGQFAADTIAARVMGKTGMPKPFHYRHKGDMATIGRASAVAYFKWGHMDGVFAWLAWLFIHLWYILEFEDRILVFLQWAWNYATRNRGARLITGEGYKSKL